eukprot:7620504-Ditylum_brightwellii.AAC.1
MQEYEEMKLEIPDAKQSERRQHLRDRKFVMAMVAEGIKNPANLHNDFWTENWTPATHALIGHEDLAEFKYSSMSFSSDRVKNV